MADFLIVLAIIGFFLIARYAMRRCGVVRFN